MPSTIEPPDSRLADLQNGSPVADRLADASHGLKICKRMVDADKLRAVRRKKVQDCFNGNAPKDHREMKLAGRESDSNLNFRRHRGQIMNAWTVLFDMLWEVPVCIDGDLETGDAAVDGELMRGFAEYFHDMVFGWRGFDDVTQLCDLQMLLHGPGILAWEDPWDWRPKAILAGNFYVPDGTSGSLDDCEMAMITTSMSAGKLWRKISDEKTAVGWNIEAVKATIMDSALNGSPMRNQRWIEWDRAFKNGDLHVSETQTRKIDLYTLFVEEMDGTISQKVLPQKEGIGSVKQHEFLFDDRSRYDAWRECVCLYPYDIGADGSFHSIKGLGTDIYAHSVLLNDIDNSIADLVVAGIKPMWQAETGDDVSRFQMATWGGGKMVPRGIKNLTLNMGASIVPALEASRAFSQTLSANTAAAHPSELSAPTVEETARSAMIRAAERAKTSKGLHNRVYRGHDGMYTNVFARASNPKLRSWHPGSREALRFQERCYKLCDKFGVPRGTLQKVENIRANRSLGLGSPALRIEIVNQLSDPNFLDRLPEAGQNEVLRMKAAVMTSYHSVDSIIPSITTARDPTNDEAVAAQENNAFSILGPEAEAPVVPGQNHVLHLGVHVPSMEKDAEACQQGGMEPRECQKRLEGKGGHSQHHLAVLQGNPTKQREFKEFSARLQQLASYQDHLDQTIAEEDEAAAEQPQPGVPTPDEIKVRGNLELKSMKDRGSLALKAQAQDFRHGLQAQDLAAKTRLADLSTAAKIRREAMAAAAKARQTATNGNGA